MHFTIGSIIFPSDSKDATRLYLGFLIKTLHTLDIHFSGYGSDPLALAEKYVTGGITCEQCKAESLDWWRYIDSQDAVQAFHDRDVLMARLAICLLSFDENDASDLSESLSWFIEVIGFMEADVDKAIEIMINYFEQRSA
ncbi:hypothetical protein ABRP91_09600 [Pectobacterium brasiliense]|uniref:hypothetical protein n=1 Tax=Pectobacterium brasiliense TaxID=180957 RepID=UPI0032EF26FF